MNRIDSLFSRKKGNILSVYFTAGYPNLNDTVEIIRQLAKSGVDMIEIGMPFSDPLADGPVIQQSSTVALKNGMSIEILFSQLKDIRREVEIPLILMGYLNPVMQYGVDAFCKKAAECGIDGLILPDLPPDVYGKTYKDLFIRYGLHHILLITPRTPEERIVEIDKLSGGFIYAVSSSSTTGNQLSETGTQQQYFERIQSMNLSNPVMIGFGISAQNQFKNACKYASGAVIGTAFIKAIADEKLPISERVKDFVSSFY